MSKLRAILTGGVCAACIAIVGPAMAQETRVDGAMNQSANATNQAVQAQARMDASDAERLELFADYRGVVQDLARQRLYVERLNVYLQSQNNEIDDIRLQVERVDEVVGELEPMLIEMVDRLEQFIMSDIPFLREERLARIAQRRAALNDHDVSPGEKYRAIINAYGIEADYGRFVRTWEARLGGDDEAPMVDYILFGRVAWTYLTKDEKEAWMWNVESESWERLDNKFIPDMRAAMRIAQEKASQDLYRGPVPAPTVASAAN